MVHVEQADAQLVEDDVQPIVEAHRLLVGLAESTHSRVLRREGRAQGLQWNPSTVDTLGSVL